MKRLLAFFLLFPALCGLASSVLWGGAVLSPGGPTGSQGEYTLSWPGLQNGTDEHPGLALYPCLFFSISSGPEKTTVKNIPIVLAAYGDNWRRLEPGDSCNSESLRGNHPYFFKGGLDLAWDEDGRSDYDITIPFHEATSVFLGVASRNDLYDSANPPEVCYGWVELVFFQGNVTVSQSALDLSGHPLVVGQVPEPASSALALAGLTLLIGRRRRTVT